MHALCAVSMALMAAAMSMAAGEPGNVCTNGSFENLARDGSPADWSIWGQGGVTTDDVHSGRRALRLKQGAKRGAVEAGLNRKFDPDSGTGGALIDRVTGGMDFWYKAVSGGPDSLYACVIPMNRQPAEESTAGRAIFTVPPDHIGDGEWHHARLRFDYSKSESVRWVCFGVRVNPSSTPGELLLDDVAYVEHVGLIPRFAGVSLERFTSGAGAGADLHARIENAGDRLIERMRIVVETPDALRVDPPEMVVTNLDPDTNRDLTWHLCGEVTGGTVTLRAQYADGDCVRHVALSPQLEVVSFGPCSPVARRDLETPFECVARNTGNAVAEQVKAVFQLQGSLRSQTAEQVAPGETVHLRGVFMPSEETEDLPVSLEVHAANAPSPATQYAHVIVGSGMASPAPANRLSANAEGHCAVLENDRVRLVFPKNQFGFGTGCLWTKTPNGWVEAGWLPYLTRVIYRDATGKRREETVYASDPPEATLGESATLAFTWSFKDRSGGRWRGLVTFAVGAESTLISAAYEASCDEPRSLLAFDGPMVYVLDRKEAIFPGLEWLVGDEVSSNDLDIGELHPDRIRYVVHPNMVTVPAIAISGGAGVTGLLWDASQHWDAEHDRPSPVFASPDRFNNQRAHLMGLMLPTVPRYLDPNTREAARAYPLHPGQSLCLRACLFADGSATDPIDAIEAWFGRYGFPDPSALPRGSYDSEIQFSMQAYLDSAWIPESKEWWSSKGSGACLKTKVRPHACVADLLVGAILSPDPAVRDACRARAEEVAPMIGGDARLDAQRFPGHADRCIADEDLVRKLLMTMCPTGGWPFDPNRKAEGIYKGVDYHTFGTEGAVELGTTASSAASVLRYARIVGDWDVYRDMAPTLEIMERFQVPRGAQSWEVPLHAPDLMAAADALNAFLEAYRLCRAYDHPDQDRWLRDAVTWARRGLPFIYCWDDPKLPFLRGASIAVFGSSWYTTSWFGRPVQWNGLYYANGLLDLAEYDRSLPWARIATTIVHSALHQQETEGEDIALYTDNISAIDGTKYPWYSAPRRIVESLLKLMGRSEDPSTTVVRTGSERFHITSTSAIVDAECTKDGLRFGIGTPRGEEGLALVSHASRPAEVRVDDKTVQERAEVESGRGAGWRYDEDTCFLTIRVPHDGTGSVSVRGMLPTVVSRLPKRVDTIDFTFDDGPDGWVAQNDIDSLTVQSGVLTGTYTGTDPYLFRPVIAANGDDCPGLALRMRVTSGTGAQFFWTTAQAPSIDLERSITIPIVPDGEYHEYTLDLSDNPLWRHQIITGIRLDPGGGDASGEFGIDYLRKE